MAKQKADRGPIEPGVFYPMAAFQPLVGFGDSAMRAARKNGLRVIYLHKRPFVLESDFISYLTEAGTASK
jgi:hypothetical protein